MGKKENKTYKPTSDNEAWIGILYACIASDGEVGKSEIDALSRMLANKIKFEGIDLVPLCKNITDAFNVLGVEGLVDSCSPIISERDKPTLFSMAVDIVLSDGLLEAGERKIIEYIATSLQIENTLILKIVEVMLIRNRGNMIVE